MYVRITLKVVFAAAELWNTGSGRERLRGVEDGEKAEVVIVFCAFR